MKFFRLVTFLFVFISVVWGNIANATMLCCISDYSQNKPTQVDSKKADMPCHEDTEKTSSKSCKNCKSCVNTNFVILLQPFYQIGFANITHDIEGSSFVSALPNAIYSPPKYIS